MPKQEIKPPPGYDLIIPPKGYELEENPNVTVKTTGTGFKNGYRVDSSGRRLTPGELQTGIGFKEEPIGSLSAKDVYQASRKVLGGVFAYPAGIMAAGWASPYNPAGPKLSMDKAEQLGGVVGQAIIGEPETEPGKRLAAGLNAPLEGAFGPIGQGIDYAAKTLYPKSETGQAAVRTGLGAALLILPYIKKGFYGGFVKSRIESGIGLTTKELGVIIEKTPGIPKEVLEKVSLPSVPYSMADLPMAIRPIVEKIKAELPKQKLLRKVQDIAVTAEKSRRFAKAEAAWTETGGEEGFYAALRNLEGEYPKYKSEQIGGKLTQAERDAITNFIHKAPAFGGQFTDALNATEAINKLFRNETLQKGEIKLLYEALGKDIPEEILKQRPFWEKAKDVILEVTNLPRAFMSTLDDSFGGRQGIFAAAANPKEFASAFKASFKMFGNEKAFRSLKERIVADPDYGLARMAKLPLTDVDTPFMVGREEAWRGGHLAEALTKPIPFVGKAIRGSDLAYTGMANHLRFGLFKKFLDLSEIAGDSGRTNPLVAKKIANFVGDITGRSSLPGKLESASDLLNIGFFAPRLVASRIKTLASPLSYMNSPKLVRIQAIKTWASFAAAGAATIAAVKVLGDAFGVDVKIGDNPYSSDFGKLIFGNTRIDIWGGYQQYVRTAFQFAGGKTVSPSGKITKVGEGYKPLTRKEILLRFFESKESPTFSLANDFLTGRTFTGEKFNLGKELSERFIPIYSSMFLQDALDIYKDNPNNLLLAIPGFFGVGIQTYQEKKKPVDKALLERLRR